jgi:hypothetical protein
MNGAFKASESADYRRGLGIFLTETPLATAAKYLFHPLSPALRSDPIALSGASRQKQIPSSQPPSHQTLVSPVEPGVFL